MQSPDQMPVFDLLLALDEPLVKNDAASATESSITPLRVVVDKFWEGMNQQVNNYFRQATLNDLLIRYRIQSSADVYYI